MRSRIILIGGARLGVKCGVIVVIDGYFKALILKSCLLDKAV